MNTAHLIGISQYDEGKTLEGVPNDLMLIKKALLQHGYKESQIYSYLDTLPTRKGLHLLMENIQSMYKNIDSGSCYIHVSAGGMFALDPVRGGIKPSDGNFIDFGTAFSFADFNSYLPIQENVHVITTLDI